MGWQKRGAQNPYFSGSSPRSKGEKREKGPSSHIRSWKTLVIKTPFPNILHSTRQQKDGEGGNITHRKQRVRPLLHFAEKPVPYSAGAFFACGRNPKTSVEGDTNTMGTEARPPSSQIRKRLVFPSCRSQLVAFLGVILTTVTVRTGYCFR